MEFNIESEYNALGKKYNLPKFSDLDKEFEISDIDKTNFLLRHVLRGIAEKLDFYANLISELLQPDTASLSSMHEIRFLTEDEKSDMYGLFKRIMKINRNVLELILEQDEKKQASSLNNFYSEWMEIKKELLAHISKMKESWDKETAIEEDLGYMG